MINTKKAFSFIEVIIASSIIVIISVVAATNYSGMQDKTTNSKVLSDIQTLNNSILAYNKAKSEYPDPKGNQKFFGSNGEYKHAKDSDFVFGVSGFVSNNVIPKEFMNYLPIDPRTNQYYAYAKTIETNKNIKKQGFQIGGVVLENNTPKSLISGNYTGEQGPLDIIKDYTSPEFVPNDSTSLFPYNPEERVLVGKIQNASAIAQVSVNGVTATANMQVGQGDLVKVASGNTVEIYYSDGTSALLGDTTQDTVLHLTNLSYKEENNLLTNISQILKSGNILVKASSLDQGDTDSEFNVYTEDVVASVRGTIFNVNANTNQDTVTVIEGTVDVNPTPTEVKNEIQSIFNIPDTTSQQKEIDINLPEEIILTGSGKTIKVEKGGVPAQIKVDTPITGSTSGIRTAVIQDPIKLGFIEREKTLNSIPDTASGIIQEVTTLQTKEIEGTKVTEKTIDMNNFSSENLSEYLSGNVNFQITGLNDNTKVVLISEQNKYYINNKQIVFNDNTNGTKTNTANNITYLNYDFGDNKINQICKNITITDGGCDKYGMEQLDDTKKCTSCVDLEGKKKISIKQDTIVDLLKNGPTKITDLNSTLKFNPLTDDELPVIIGGSGSFVKQQLVFLDNDGKTLTGSNNTIFWSAFNERNTTFSLKDNTNSKKGDIKKACIVLSNKEYFNTNPPGFNTELKIGTDYVISNCIKEKYTTLNVNELISKTIDKSKALFNLTNMFVNTWKNEKECNGVEIFGHCAGFIVMKEIGQRPRNFLIFQLSNGNLLKYDNGIVYNINNNTKISEGLSNENFKLNLEKTSGYESLKITKICRDTWLYLQHGEGPAGSDQDKQFYIDKCKNRLGPDFKFNTSSDNYRNYTGNSKVYGGRHYHVTDGNTGDTKYILCTTCDY